MPKCHKFYPNSQWTVAHCWLNLEIDTVLLTKVYWKFSTHIVRVCFTPLLKPTLKRDPKRKSNVQITSNSPAMTSLYELLCYHSPEVSDRIMDEFLTFIHSTLSSLSSAILSEAIDCNFNKF